MKRRLVVLAIIGICVLSVMAIAGCSCNGNAQKEHIEHSWTAWERVKDPDCENEGLEVRNCSECDKSETRPVDALSHSFGELTEKIEPQCEVPGQVAYYECGRCHKKFDENQERELNADELEIKPLSHSFDELTEKIEPQCEVAGQVAYYECGRCHKKFDENQERELNDEDLVIKAKEHSYGEIIPQEDASCEKTGMKAHYECENCGKLLDDKKQPTTKKELEIHATGHTYGELIPRRDASCGTAGEEAHYHCDMCNKNFDTSDERKELSDEELEIKPLSHSFGELTEKIEPQCEVVGQVAYYECENCHKKFDKDQESELDEDDLVIDALGHSFDELTEKIEPQCEVPGQVAYYECGRCHKKFDEDQEKELNAEDLVIKAKEHCYGQLIPQEEASCEKTGMKAHYECENCGKLLDDKNQPTTEKNLKIDALGHSFDKLTERIEPQCEVAGQVAYYECGNCHKKFAEDQEKELNGKDLVINATGHSYGQLIPQKDASCETVGEEAHYHCDKCNKNFDTTDERKELNDDDLEIDVLGHSFDELTKKIEPQCEVAGQVAYYECGRCHKKFDENQEKELNGDELEIKPLSHSFGELTEKIEPQCEVPGQVAYYECGRCHKKFDEDQEKELNDEDLVIKAKEHSYGQLISKKDASCETEGMEAHYECDNCGKYFDDKKQPKTDKELVINATGHSYGQLIPQEDASCEKAGKKAHYHCDKCNKNFDTTDERKELSDEDLVIKAKEHSFETKYNETQHYSECKLCFKQEGFENHNTDIEDYECSKCDWHSEYTQTLTFKEEGDGYTVTGATNAKLTKIVIPDTYREKPVLKIGDDAFRAKDENTPRPIVNVIFGKNIEEIGDNAFWNCKNLRNVELPSGLKTIGAFGFASCVSLDTINFGPSLQKLDTQSFWGCSGLRGAIDFPKSLNYVGQWAFSGCSGIESIEFSGSVEIIESAFYGCSALTTASFGDGDVTMGNWVFQNCSSMSRLTFGNGDITLGTSLFYNAYALEEVTFSNGNKNIADWVFYNNMLGNIDFGDGNVTLAQYAIASCSSLNSVTFGDGKVTLAQESFYDCSALETVVFGDGDPEIEQNVFSMCSSLSTLEFGDGAHCFEENTFSSCDGLKTLRFGKGTTRIDEYTFYTLLLKELSFGGGNVTIGASAFSYSPITTLTFGNGTYDIGERAFASCNNIATLTFNDGDLTLAKNAFDNCKSLTSVVFGAGEKEISDSVFMNCPVNSIVFGDGRLTVAKNGLSWLDELRQVTFGNGPVILGEQTFYDCKALESVCFYGETTVGDRAFLGCKALSSVRFENGNVNLTDYSFSGCSGLKNVYVGDGETIIGKNCFFMCDGLETFEKAAGNVDIGENAFHETGIRNVIIHGDCTIGLRAFWKCSNLLSVTLEGKIESIGFQSFADCASLSQFSISDDIGEINSGAFEETQGIGLITYMDAEYLGNADNQYALLMRGTNKTATSITIHSDTRVICGRAFADYTLLQSVVIPENVVQIGDYAFKGCKALNEVTISESVRKIGNSAFRDCSELKTLTINGGDKQIREFAFEHCEAIESVNVSDLETWLSLRFEGTQRVGSTNPLYYGATLNVGGKALTSLVIPDEISEISSLAFAGYDRLTSVKLGRGVKHIDPSAFFWCNELVSITGENDYYTTENNCIIESSSMTIVVGCAGSSIPNDVAAIGKYAFYGVKFRNASLTLPDSLLDIGEHAFYASNLSSLTVGGGLKSIGSQAFGAVGTNGLEELHINNLKVWCEIEFADSGSVALDYCIIYVNETRVTHNQNVLVITDDITEIKDYAFWHSQITTVKISANTTKISNKAFAASPSLNNITVDEQNPVYKVKNCGLFDKNTKTIVIGTLEKNTNSVKIDDEVEHIAPYAFMNRLVKSLTLSSSVKDIGEYAFYQCRIEGSIIITEAVTKIGENAFAHNTNATKVVIPSSVNYIGKDAFYQTALTTAEFAVTNGWKIIHYFFGTSMTPNLSTASSAANQLKESGYVWTRE